MAALAGRATTGSASNWSVYGQLATGTIVPPIQRLRLQPDGHRDKPHTAHCDGAEAAAVDDVPVRYGGEAEARHASMRTTTTSASRTATRPSPTRPRTRTIFYLQPASITKGFEGESNIYFGARTERLSERDGGPRDLHRQRLQACTGTAAHGLHRADSAADARQRPQGCGSRILRRTPRRRAHLPAAGVGFGLLQQARWDDLEGQRQLSQPARDRSVQRHQPVFELHGAPRQPSIRRRSS